VRILIDMDDVLECLVQGFVDYHREKYGTTTTAEDINNWDLALAFPTLTREQVYSPEREDGFWKYVKPLPGADEALRQLIAEGHEIYIVTASFYESLRAKMDDVLFRYYPYLSWDQVIITANKQLIKGDILIDDGPHNLEGGEYRAILFDAPHNRSYDEKAAGVIRAHGWDEVLAAVEKIGKELQKE